MKKGVVLVKYGGNAMTSPESEQHIVTQIANFHKNGHSVVVVHGGGPFISSLLDEAQVETEFVHGHRKTDENAIDYVEMALSGQVNGRLVNALNLTGIRAVGLSGKDANFTSVTRRFAKSETGKNIDIGLVGNVDEMDISLIRLLLDNRYVPVVSPVSMDESGKTININADMFAGHLAGALNAAHYIVLTDVNGLRKDVNEPSSVITKLTYDEASEMLKDIQGGMIPKIESCLIALKNGATLSHIAHGNDTIDLTSVIDQNNSTGTTITKNMEETDD